MAALVALARNANDSSSAWTLTELSPSDAVITVPDVKIIK